MEKMKDSIYTIPISEVFEEKCGCPLCRIRDTLEDRCTEYIMGAAMMEPDIRIETNRLGFCSRHYAQMLGRRNRLSLALMMETHLTEVQKRIFGADALGLFDKQSRAKKAEKLTGSCYVCGKIEENSSRMLDNLLDLYEREKAFRLLFAEQEYFCLPHYQQLLSRGAARLSKNRFPEFRKTLDQITGDYLQALQADVLAFTKLYDYRNAGGESPDENVRESVERAVAFLTAGEGNIS
ncbi:MAG TPA: hypothetical protein H9671_03880 [Firmicutes bacterium]|nr:hypothetical protein [Bacillota bacterium]